MAIVKYKNQSGIEYAYESTSSWDPVKKQSRPVRKYLGRVDPETGEIIPTEGKRGRPKKKPETNDAGGNSLSPELLNSCGNQTEALTALQMEIQKLKAENQELRKLLTSIRELLEKEKF